jgi:CRISPR-associated endonuclease/helicase Cas3
VSLSVDDFDAFHAAVHGEKSAFGWQKRLLRQIVERRRWPALLDLPTGSGKTTSIDIALFALALDVDQPAAERWCPRRIAMVVDRRVVVDQAAERGRALLAALTRVDAPQVIREVAARLRALTRSGEKPLDVFTLRGGIPKDDTWARSPDQPLVIASTVDQIGSRLLIQGYGVSPEMRPVHAGLLGNDVLLLLDEVHLSRPFAETLDQLSTLRGRFDRTPSISQRFQHVFLSATPGAGEGDVFRLGPEEQVLAAALGRRLHASKRTQLVEVTDRSALVRECVLHAEEMIRRHDVVAVVLNRVASASDVARRLTASAERDYDVVLITGRMRPLDRDDALRSLRPRIQTGRDRTRVDRKLIVVGTQSIEAGADFDFDALVTEIASLDALRQRFGRVDRLGIYGRAEGVIVWDKQNKEDFVYGSALFDTGSWLKDQLNKKNKDVDFGVLALPLPSGPEMRTLVTPTTHAPVLMPAYMEMWVQTSPTPAVVPDVGLWLHGPESGPPDVQVIWRADVTEADLAAARRSKDRAISSRPVEAVESVRPSSLEALSLPFVAARRWLADQEVPDIADVEGPSIDDSETQMTGLALRWRGADSDVITPEGLQPGDTIVVPASRGGIRDGCFDPSCKKPVADFAERASLFSRGRPALRLHPHVLAQLGLLLPVGEDIDDVRGALRVAAEDFPDGSWQSTWLLRLAAGGAASIIVDAAEPWLVLQGRRVPATEIRRMAHDESVEDGVEQTTDPEDSPHVGRRVPLTTHTADVERFAREYAVALGMADTLVEDLALAASLHDLGKADRRFQILLRGGSELEWFKDERLLAKSGMPRMARSAHRIAQQRSGYPRGARHEVLSTAMVVDAEVLARRAHDRDLVLHLIASHHGYCRPFAPPIVDPDPVMVGVRDHHLGTFGVSSFGPISSRHALETPASGVADRFWKLVEAYGWHGLCWLEAVFRLADHRASEMEETSGGEE